MFATFNLKTAIGRLRIVAILEGISYLLFAVTMPLKYLLDIPGPNRVIGMGHGLLFIVYILMVVQCALIYNWSKKNSALALVASIIPFGTFIADARIFRRQEVL